MRMIALLLALSALLLQACAPAVVGGAAVVGASVVHDRRSPGTVIDDNLVELNIRGRINEDEALAERVRVGIASYNGVVLLTGQAPSAADRARVERLARGVDKVRHVYNELEVAGAAPMLSRSSDTLLGTRIKARMLAEKGFDPTRVKVVVEEGVVYLLGLVNEREAHVATELARTTRGVKKVVKLFEYLPQGQEAGGPNGAAPA
jgi:osmotically-inducible protein OsmY